MSTLYIPDDSHLIDPPIEEIEEDETEESYMFRPGCTSDGRQLTKADYAYLTHGFDGRD